jgi:hypothetical protein
VSTAVRTVASGGLAVVDVTATLPIRGMAVTESLTGYGIAVTKVASGGVPVTFVVVSTSGGYPR